MDFYFKVGAEIATNMLNNGATLGTTGTTFHASEMLVSIGTEHQHKERTRKKKSGFANYRTFEGMLKPAKVVMKFQAQTGVPLSWVTGSHTTGSYTHAMTIPAMQQPNFGSASPTTQIPALCIRIEQLSGTYANDVVDLLGVVITQLQITVEDGGIAEYNIEALCYMVLPGVSKITSNQPADLSQACFAWQHLVTTFTYNSKTVGLHIDSVQLTIKLKWQNILSRCLI